MQACSLACFSSTGGLCPLSLTHLSLTLSPDHAPQSFLGKGLFLWKTRPDCRSTLRVILPGHDSEAKAPPLPTIAPALPSPSAPAPRLCSECSLYGPYSLPQASIARENVRIADLKEIGYTNHPFCVYYSIFVVALVWFWFLREGFPYIALAVPEFTLYTWLASNSQRYTCLCCPSDGTEGMLYPCPAQLHFLRIYSAHR